MKKLLSIIVALVVIGAFTASAQQYSAVLSTNIVIAASGNTNIALAVTLTKYDEAALEVIVSGGAALTNGNIVTTFKAGAGGTGFPNTLGTLSVATDGATTAYGVSNLFLYAQGYLQVYALSNGSATATSTNTVKVWVKPKRNG